MDAISDKRRTYTFYVDDTVIDVFGPRIGAYGIAVYALLARHAKNKRAFPSYKHMKQQLGLSRQTITRTLEKLISVGLITKARRQSSQGDQDTNLYTLMDLSPHHYPPCCHLPRGTSLQDLPPSPQEPPTSLQDGGVRPHGTGGRSPRRLEGISRKESHRKESKPSPYSPPTGGPGEMERSHPASARRRRKTYYPTDPEEQTQLRESIVDQSLQDWATQKDISLDLPDQWEKFAGKAIANAYMYVDWRAAFKNWLTSPYQTTVPTRKATQDRQQAVTALVHELERQESPDERP